MIRRSWTRLKRSWTRLKRSIGGIFKKGGFWWIALVLSTLGVCGYLTLTYWPYLHDGNDSLSSTIRNVSLVIGGIIAMELALWRSIVSERQTTVSQQQAETAQRDLLNQQFQKGAEMLGSSVLSVRLGGIYALRHLGVEHPEHYHVQVMEQLCAFVRGATSADGQSTAVIEETRGTREELLDNFPDREDLPNWLTTERFRARNDIQEAMNAIAYCHAGNLAIETDRGYWLNLRGADLMGVDLSTMNLSRAPLRFVLSTSDYPLFLTGRYTDMRGVKLDDASFLATNLARVDLSDATGLTQAELDGARADPNYVPKLDGVIDPNTGKPLVWIGSAAKDE